MFFSVVIIYYIINVQSLTFKYLCFFQSSVFKRIKIYDYQAICLETEGEGSSSSVMLSVSSELNDKNSA